MGSTNPCPRVLVDGCQGFVIEVVNGAGHAVGYPHGRHGIAIGAMGRNRALGPTWSGTSDGAHALLSHLVHLAKVHRWVQIGYTR